MELSLLTQDTKKSDVVPEALGLPLRPPEEQKGELAARMKGELAARMKRKAAMMEVLKVVHPACGGVSLRVPEGP